MGEFALGQPVPRFEDPRLIRGGGRYVDDMVLPRMVFGVVLRSPHAHARIVSIDTSAAKAAPGVLAVLTGADWEQSGWHDLPTPGGLKRGDGSPTYRPRFPALTSDRVRWVGDYVAFVVAETRPQAQDAAELIAVEYEPLPAIVDTAAAAEPDALRVWEDAPDNISFVHREGNEAAADAAFAGAAHVVRRRLGLAGPEPGRRQSRWPVRRDFSLSNSSGRMELLCTRDSKLGERKGRFESGQGSDEKTVR